MKHIYQEWTQEELRAHLASEGFDLGKLEPGEIIPQYVKFAKFAPVTAEDIDWAKRQMTDATDGRAGDDKL